MWKAYFEKTFQKPDIPPCDRQEDIIKYNNLLDSEITCEEVRSAINNLSASKAPGLDGIPGGCLKVACQKIVPFLTKIFNVIFETCSFPEMWSRSVIIPIHKKVMYLTLKIIEEYPY